MGALAGACVLPALATTGLEEGLVVVETGFAAGALAFGGDALAAGFFNAGLGAGAFLTTFLGAAFEGTGFLAGAGFFWVSVFLAGAGLALVLEAAVFLDLAATGLALPWAAFFLFRVGLLTV
jgi:hypothetical protein